MNAYPNVRINQELNAKNVIELKVDHEVVLECFDEVAQMIQGGYFEGTRLDRESGICLYSVCPQWNGDLRWISSGNKKCFDIFDKYFERLKIQSTTKELLGDYGELIMYSGFFVVRSHSTESYYHDDYCPEVGMNAFTLMTPVHATGKQGNLLYQDVEGNEQVYRYSTGNAVCFGGDFIHSTEPFESEEPYVFLCFTYGVRNEDLWDAISQTVAEQGLYYRHPQEGVVENQE